MKLARSEKQATVFFFVLTLAAEVVLSVFLGTWWLNDFDLFYLVIYWVAATLLLYEHPLKDFLRKEISLSRFGVSATVYLLGVAGAIYGLLLYFVG